MVLQSVVDMTPWIAFITGLSTGGLTCMAVQGGLLLGVLAKRSGDEQTSSRWWQLVVPVGGFLIAKTVAYTLFGFLLGAIGSKLQLSTTVSVWLQAIAGAFIVITGIRLIWPQWLPWLNIQAPASLRRFIRRQGRSDTWLAPAMLGLLTIFIPCGTTIAMETAAVAAGTPLKGAAILLAFVLGTAPLFFLVGILAKGTMFAQKKLSYATAAIVIILGIYTFNGALVTIDSPYSIQNEVAAVRWTLTGQSGSGGAQVTSVDISVLPNGYSPNAVTVPAGQPVSLILTAKGRLGCTSIFRIPKLNIQQQVDQNSPTTLAVNFPTPGRYTFTCGMGMYTGTIEAT